MSFQSQISTDPSSYYIELEKSAQGIQGMKPECDKLLAHVKTITTTAGFVKKTYWDSEQGKTVQSKLDNLMKQCQTMFDKMRICDVDEDDISPKKKMKLDSDYEGGIQTKTENLTRQFEDLMFHLDVLNDVFVLLEVIHHQSNQHLQNLMSLHCQLISP